MREMTHETTNTGVCQQESSERGADAGAAAGMAVLQKHIQINQLRAARQTRRRQRAMERKGSDLMIANT